MVRHLVFWSFKEGLSPAENAENAAKIKAGLEALPGIIDGIRELNVYTSLYEGSTTGIVINGLYESREALQNYSAHPAHKKVSSFVHEVMQDRQCADYDE